MHNRYCKRLGHKIDGFNQEKWDEQAPKICNRALREKFDHSSFVKEYQGTKSQLIKNRASRGGGVMLYVKEEIGAIHRTDLETNDTELLLVELRLGNKKVMFGTWFDGQH